MNVEQFSDKAEETSMYRKALRLISAEWSRELGLSGESPVFISPYISREMRCGDCGNLFRPLVYQAGYVVEAHCFHERDMGQAGIYYYDGIGGFLGYWVADVQPIGRRNIGRAEKVLVSRIRTFCYVDHEELQDGIVASLPMSMPASELIPLCSLDKHKRGYYKPRFNFSGSPDGAILFKTL